MPAGRAGPTGGRLGGRLHARSTARRPRAHGRAAHARRNGARRPLRPPARPRQRSCSPARWSARQLSRYGPVGAGATGASSPTTTLPVRRRRRRPARRRLHFNLSHTDGLVALAIGRGHRVGVDVEAVTRPVLEDVPERHFAARRSPRPAGAARRRPAARVLRLLDAQGGLHQGPRHGPGACRSTSSRSRSPPVSRRPSASPPGFDDDERRWQFWQAWPTATHRLALAVERDGADLPVTLRQLEPRRSRAVTVWAISDLHVGFDVNRRAVEALPARPDDWLIVAGDTGDTLAQLEAVLDVVTARFARVIWTPGNHDLWTPRQWPDARRGEAHYRAPGRGVPGTRRGHARGSVPGVAGPEPGGHRALLHALRLLVRAGRAVARRRRRLGRRDRRAVRRRGAAVAGAVRRRAATGAPRASPTPRLAWPRSPAGTRIALVNHYPVAARSGGAAAHPAVHDLVRHDEDGRLAHALSGGRRRLGPPPHAQHQLARRRALRGGVARLSGAVAARTRAPRPTCGRSCRHRPPADRGWGDDRTVIRHR